MAENDVHFTITADGKDAEQELNDVGDAAEKVGKKTADSWKETEAASKKFSLGVAAVAASITALAVVSVNQAREAIANEKQLDAVLRSTAGAAGVQREEAIGLASALSRVTNFTDDTILSGENLLLTFTNIGKDIFPQVTETMLNMSQALGQDTKNSAIQLGKALQDPIQGVTALSRVGVNFTDQQKAMIKTLVESGHALDAQKMILKELETEFGGSARALMDPITQVTNQIGELGEAIGRRLLPYVDAAANAFLGWLDSMGGVEGIVNVLAGALDFIAPYFPIIAGAIIGGMVPAFIALAGAIWSVMAPLIPFMAAGAALAGLAYLIYQAWTTNFLGMRDAIVNVLNELSAFMTILLQNIQAAWRENFLGIQDIVFAAWEIIKSTIGIALEVILGGLKIFFDLLRGDWSAAWNDLLMMVDNIMMNLENILTNVFSAILSIVNAALTTLANIVPAGLNFIADVFVNIWGGIHDFVGAIWKNILQFVTDNIPFIGKYIAGAADFIASCFSQLFSGVGAVVSGIFNWVVNAFVSTLNWIIGKINAVIGMLNKIPKQFGGGGLSTIGTIGAGEAAVATATQAAPVAAPTVGQLPTVTRPTFGGGGAGGGSGGGETQADKDAKKVASDTKAAIAKNISQLTSDIKTAQSTKDQNLSEIKTLQEKVKDMQGGAADAAVKAQVQARIAELQQKNIELDKQVQTKTAQLQRSNEEAAIQNLKEIEAQKQKLLDDQKSDSLMDLIDNQNQADAAAAAAKKKASSTSSSSSGSSSSGTSVSSLASAAARGDLSGQGIVLLDVNGSGDKIYNIDIHDNDFYGDDKTFAQKIGDTIVQTLKLNISSPAS